MQLTHITLSLNGFKIIIKPSKSFSSYYSHALAILNNVSDSIPILEKIFFDLATFYFNICVIYIHTRKCTYSSVQLDEFLHMRATTLC